ncbi:regulatory protein RecX [Litchfieldella qijiaojingensis]|uniref:Regulatory protein RecX n=1 Tax=Litchfieldella qijiaojingensis TaxID=980347 RepID=A0ABQ2Z2H7_9GAMM|nr:regulatory protein RecX [Halomonas qijiaojingensis]GGX99666.1 regulatory protein RecX [Halomonas qijiaojingensis]
MLESQESQASPSPYDDAIRLLARREYSRAELEARLAAKGHDGEDVAACLERLAEQGLQSDTRFAEHFIRSRVGRGQGPLKILAELGNRGIASEFARSALAEYEASETVDWYELACDTLGRRFSSPGDTPSERARRERFLAGRGFDFDQVRHALSHAWDA